MAPQRCSKPRRTTSKEPAQHEGSEDERASQQDSQSSGDDNKVMRIAEKMRKDSKLRLQNRRASINKSHEESMKKIEDNMSARFDEIATRMRQGHKSQIERLYGLLKRRSDIEARMLASSKRIDEAYEMAEKALAHALGRRLQALTEHEKKGQHKVTREDTE